MRWKHLSYKLFANNSISNKKCVISFCIIIGEINKIFHFGSHCTQKLDFSTLNPLHITVPCKYISMNALWFLICFFISLQKKNVNFPYGDSLSLKHLVYLYLYIYIFAIEKVFLMVYNTNIVI